MQLLHCRRQHRGRQGPQKTHRFIGLQAPQQLIIHTAVTALGRQQPGCACRQHSSRSHVVSVCTRMPQRRNAVCLQQLCVSSLQVAHSLAHLTGSPCVHVGCSRRYLLRTAKQSGFCIRLHRQVLRRSGSKALRWTLSQELQQQKWCGQPCMPRQALRQPRSAVVGPAGPQCPHQSGVPSTRTLPSACAWRHQLTWRAGQRLQAPRPH